MISKILEAQRHAPGTETPPVREARVTEPPRRPLVQRPTPSGLASFVAWIAVAAIIGGAYYYVPTETWKSLLAKVMPTSGPVAAAKGPRIIPVVTSPARQGDMDIYVDCLGTVTALYTVTLHSRVDGELQRVAFTEGQMVNEGDLLAEIDPRPFNAQLKQATGTLQKDEAALKIAQLDMERYARQFKEYSKSITQQALDAQTAVVKQAEGVIETDKGIIENIRLQLRYCKIVSPISGRIGLRMVDPGNIVHAADAGGMAVITQLQPITVVFTIPQDEIARVQERVNTGEPVVVDVFNRDFRTHLATGKLTALDNQVDALTGTVRLKATFENKKNLLFPNQFVNARLLIGSEHDVVIVPTASVQRGPDSTFVYVVEQGAEGEATVALRKVTLGPVEADEVVITSGLAPGDAVVVDGIDKLQPGTKVVVRGRGAAGEPDPKSSGAPAGSSAEPRKS